jgi:hypothetical protein
MDAKRMEKQLDERDETGRSGEEIGRCGRASWGNEEKQDQPRYKIDLVAGVGKGLSGALSRTGD